MLVKISIKQKGGMMKKMLLILGIILFVCCGPRKTTVETEGLEEVIVFGEEEPVVTEEPVVIEEAIEEPGEAVVPPPIEEPPVIEETPPLVVEEPIIEEPVVEEPLIEELPVIEEPEVIEEAYVPPTTTTLPPTKVYGFRVQIFASSTEGNAMKVANDARTSFTQKVYIDYVAPYYKVRVGDCLVQEDAQILKSKALKLGYRGAFIVETMITP
jgi:hypothetical protein